MSLKWRTRVGTVRLHSGQIAIIDPVDLEHNLEGVGAGDVIKELQKILPVTISTKCGEGIYPIYYEKDTEGDGGKSRIIVELNEETAEDEA